MARNFIKVVAGCAAVLIVIFAVACGTQSKQETTPTTTGTTTTTESTQAPAQTEQTAPAEGTAPSDAAAPAAEQPQQN